MRNLEQIGLNIWVRSVKNQFLIGLFRHLGDVIMLVHLLTYVQDLIIELVSKELNHFGVITGLFRQIGGHSSRFVLFCSF